MFMGNRNAEQEVQQGKQKIREREREAECPSSFITAPTFLAACESPGDP